MRLLVTCSRDWEDEATAQWQLYRAWTHLGALYDVTLISGHAGDETRCDRLLEKIWHGWGLQVERHVALWNAPCDADCRSPRRVNKGGYGYCPDAGFKRNQQMVDSGADLCLELRNSCAKDRCRKPKPHWSHGSEDCADRAEQAGIPTWRVPA